MIKAILEISFVLEPYIMKLKLFSFCLQFQDKPAVL